MGRRPKGYPSSRVGAFLNLHVVLGKLAVPDGTAPEHAIGNWGGEFHSETTCRGFLILNALHVPLKRAPQMSESPQ